MPEPLINPDFRNLEILNIRSDQEVWHPWSTHLSADAAVVVFVDVHGKVVVLLQAGDDVITVGVDLVQDVADAGGDVALGVTHQSELVYGAEVGAGGGARRWGAWGGEAFVV